MPKSIKWNSVQQRTANGRGVFTIRFDDSCEIETNCTTIAELKAWLYEQLGMDDEQRLAMLFTLMALERGTVQAANGSHRNKRVTADLSKDFSGQNAIVRAV